MKKLMKMILCGVLIGTILVLSVACTTDNTNKNATPTEVATVTTVNTTKDDTSKIDTSEEVVIEGYIPGDQQKDFTRVYDLFNAKLKKDINATLEVTCLPWGDVFTKYPVLLASGEDFDFLFEATWLNFYASAQKGAFLDLNKLLPTYAPNILKAVPDFCFDAAKVGGKIYGIPQDDPQVTQNALGYREDLRIKYNVPEIKKFSDFTAYFEAIKKNEIGMTPCSLSNELISQFTNSLFASCGFKSDGLDSIINGIGYDFDAETPVIKVMYDLPEFKQLVTLTNSWFEKGYWASSELSNKADNKAQFLAGKTAVIKQNSAWSDTAKETETKNPGWKLGMWYPTSPKGNVPLSSPMGNGFSINANAKNPERALMAIDRIMTDKTYGRLIGFGEEGKDYTFDNKGAATGETNSGYPFGSSPFGWALYKTAKFPDVLSDYQEKNTEYIRTRTIDKAKGKIPALGSFILDTSNIKAEITNINNVGLQYANPLIGGMVRTSIDKDIENIDNLLNKAGMPKVLAEINKQLDAYLKK